MDQQNLSLVRLLLNRGANPNLVSSGGHTPYHLTYGRHDDDIRKELYSMTDPDLRELPDSELDDSEEEEDEASDEEVCVRGEGRAATVGRRWQLVITRVCVSRWAMMTFSGTDISQDTMRRLQRL